ncbi:MAG: phosphate ABC transporter permease subunit PstC [Candidatus Dormibacteraeota bacterium]|nr:phosphate ABC transporter permease subunit PstC [Candidatus Dormibacteraeota bacterium]
MATSSIPERGLPSAAPARHVRPLAQPDAALGDRVLRYFCLAAAFVPAGLLLVLALVMLVRAWPAIRFSGLGFFVGHSWNFGNFYVDTHTVRNGVSAPFHAVYGAAPMIIGTLFSSIIALVLAIPIAVGGVLLLVERIPQRFQNGLGVFLELLAGIPSVVYGLWGIVIFGPLVAHYLFPFLTRILGWIPIFREPVGQGQGLLTASLVLAVMVVPIIAATTRDLLRTVPVLHKEGALAIGMTRLEVVRVVVIPFVRSGVVAASLLGWARALGETMAVLMLVGNAFNFPYNIYAPTTTIASVIASQLDSALTDATGTAVAALAFAGLVLLAITLATNWAARSIVRRTSGAALPVGAGF